MILIDADILVYRACASCEKEVEFETDYWVLSNDLTEVRQAFDYMLNSILSEVGRKTTYTLCLSGSSNFRKDIDPTYKANRAGTRKPVGFKAFRQEVIEKNPSVFLKDNLEADDCIGILATKLADKKPIIVSDDKDLMQIPGLHLKNGEIVTVEEEQGDLFHLMQTLTGDPVDGYPGCPGIGPKKAEAILSKAADKWQAIVRAYVNAGLTEDDALKQARLARILRHSDWDGDKQQPILWSPY